MMDVLLAAGVLLLTFGIFWGTLNMKGGDR